MADSYYEENSDILARLSHLKFFRNFSLEHLEKLTSYVETRTYQIGEILLRQGQLNQDVFFLLSGKVVVFVDGQEVARLDQSGDVIGEMSVISTKKTSAEIKAIEATECLVIAGEQIAEVAGNDKEETESIIYRFYSMILAEKLQKTNQKAKKFEQATLELEEAKKSLEEANQGLEEKVAVRTHDLTESNRQLEQQNYELSASSDKLRELVEGRKFAMESIDQLYRVHLPDLQTQLDLVENLIENDSLDKVKTVRSAVNSVSKLIQPVAEQAIAEQTIQSKKVLIVESNRKQQIIIKMALGGSGVDTMIASSVEEAKNHIGNENFDLVLASVANIEVLLDAQKKSEKSKLVLLASTDIQEYLPMLEMHPEISNIVSRNEEDRSFTSKHVLATVGKLLSGEVFGMEKYLAWGVEVSDWKITGSRSRRDLIGNMRERFGSLGVRSSYLERCSLVAEELLMNAIYDAPVDDLGRPKYNHLDRRQAIELEPREQGHLRVACDGSFLGVSVVDPFGAIKRSEILKYLRSCYEGRAGVYNKQKGGAGRGLHQIVENSDLVIFNVRPGVRTEVIALFYLDQKRHAENTTTSFHFFFD